MFIAELREQLQHLYAERALAAASGLDANRGYMQDLEEELEVTWRAYVIAAITEIAGLRAELEGPLAG